MTMFANWSFNIFILKNVMPNSIIKKPIIEFIIFINYWPPLSDWLYYLFHKHHSFPLTVTKSPFEIPAVLIYAFPTAIKKAVQILLTCKI